MARVLSRDLTKGPLLKNIILFTIPIILTSLLQLAFNAADMIVVGRFCGSISVAAIGATGSLTSMIVNLFMGLSVGASVSVAQAIGARDDKAVSYAVHTATAVALICGIILTIIGLFLTVPLLRLMGTPEDVLPLSSLYIRIYFCGMVFTLVYNFTAAIHRASGDTKSPLKFLAIAGLINVTLNVFFVTVFHMNVAGVALATVISQGVSATLSVLSLARREDNTRLFFNHIRIHKEAFIKILKIGLPAGIQSSLFGVSNVLIQSSVNSFGSVFMSGNAAASNIDGFIYVVTNSFYHSALAFVGQNIGAKDFPRVRKTIKHCLLCVIVAGILFASTVYMLGEKLLSLYITDSPQAIAYGMIRLAWVGLPYCLCGMMEVSTGALRSIGPNPAI